MYDYRGFLTGADTETFAYDANGNITNYNGTAFSYHGTIKDKLISVGGNTVTYAKDESLNPTSWYGRSYSYEGRRLTGFSYYGKACTYAYDEQCHRIGKSVGGVYTGYTYIGDKLVLERGPNGKLFFLYDENGQLYGFTKDGANYFYIKDITGTILGIVNESGTLVAKYSYTAFGKCTVTLNTSNIGTINPFRFKGYYYDAESGMYYCKTRYFVPEWGRWLNADSESFLQYSDINGMNLFSYCGNNPILAIDPEGTKTEWWHWVLGGLAVVGLTLLTAGVAGAAAFAVGTALGVGSALVGSAVGGALIGGFAAGAVELVTQGVTSNWESLDFGALAIETFTGAAYGGISGMMNSTTSAALRVGLRGGLVALSGINTFLHGINNGDSAIDIIGNVGDAIYKSMLIQAFFIGMDARIGKLSSSVLKSYALDGALMGIFDYLKIGLVALGKNLWRNKPTWVNIAF